MHIASLSPVVCIICVCVCPLAWVLISFGCDGPWIMHEQRRHFLGTVSASTPSFLPAAPQYLMCLIQAVMKMDARLFS